MDQIRAPTNFIQGKSNKNVIFLNYWPVEERFKRAKDQLGSGKFKISRESFDSFHWIVLASHPGISKNTRVTVGNPCQSRRSPCDQWFFAFSSENATRRPSRFPSTSFLRSPEPSCICVVSHSAGRHDG